MLIVVKLLEDWEKPEWSGKARKFERVVRMFLNEDHNEASKLYMECCAAEEQPEPAEKKVAGRPQFQADTFSTK